MPVFLMYASSSKGTATNFTIFFQEGITLLLLNLHNQMEYGVTVRNDEELHVNGVKTDKRKSCFTNHGEKIASLVGEGELIGSQSREEYHLTPQGGDLRSRKMLLNGKPLELTEDGNIPELKPQLIVDSSSPLSIPPLSIAFISFPNFKAQACA